MVEEPNFRFLAERQEKIPKILVTRINSLMSNANSPNTFLTEAMGGIGKTPVKPVKVQQGYQIDRFRNKRLPYMLDKVLIPLSQH